MQPYATESVSLGSAEEPYDSDMTHSYRLTEGRLIRYPLSHSESEASQRVGYPSNDANFGQVNTKRQRKMSDE